MIRSLTLENYRAFTRFDLHDLGRINLIVGTNNAGKTSILEAVHILEAAGEFGPMWSTLTRRGEDFDEREASIPVRQVDIRRLFHGHDAGVGTGVTLSAETDQGQHQFTARISELSPSTSSEQPQLLDYAGPEGEAEANSRAGSLALSWANGTDVRAHVALTRRGGVGSDALRLLRRFPDADRPPVIQFITASSLSPDTVIELFEDVVLTPSEEFVIEALRIIEPDIERIATSATDRRRSTNYFRSATRGGLLVRCRGVRDRIPIGSMGDGIWRLLGLALALARTEGGILLVDEIDTGLHYSVMENMWKLVSETATRLNIQVFATTHSRDCYESLAAISRASVSTGSEITIQRVERGKGRSVAYSEQEIVAAARRHLEVR